MAIVLQLNAVFFCPDYEMPSSNDVPPPEGVEIGRAVASPHCVQKITAETTSCQTVHSPHVEELSAGTANCHAAQPSKGRAPTAAPLEAVLDSSNESPSVLGDNLLQSPKGASESPKLLKVLPQFVDVGVGRTPPTFQDIEVQKGGEACATMERNIAASADSLQLAQRCAHGTHDLVTPAVPSTEVVGMQEPLFREVGVSRTPLCAEEFRPLNLLFAVNEKLKNFPRYVPTVVDTKRESRPSLETPESPESPETLYKRHRRRAQCVDAEVPALVDGEHHCGTSAQAAAPSDVLAVRGGISPLVCSFGGALPSACRSGSETSHHSPELGSPKSMAIGDADVGVASDVSFGLNDVDSNPANFEDGVEGGDMLSCQPCHTETAEVGVGPSPPPSVEQQPVKRRRTTQEQRFINLRKRVSERTSLTGGSLSLNF